MNLMAGIALLLATVIAMEAVAYCAHRWVMHGPGWFLHASHHRRRGGIFEANDLYAVIFAVPSILLLLGGVHRGWGDWAVWVGSGIATYGAIYFVFHDIIVHRRIAHRYVARAAYLKRLIQAHRLHHATPDKHGAVSFGFLWAPDARRLRATLARQADLAAEGPQRMS